MISQKWRAEDSGVIRRVEAVDLFKFLVLFFMIEGHLFRTFLLPSIRMEPWFRIHELLHGMVAPGFLFSAGFGAFLSFHNKREQSIRLNRSFFARLRRVLFVVWMGFWIHLPAVSLRKTYDLVRTGKATDFLRSDILQCIGTGLVLFLLLTVMLKKEKWIVLFSAFSCLAFFLLPGVVRKIDAHFLIKPFLDHELSNFPLFPWAGFLFLGVVTAFVFSILRREVFFRMCLLGGAAIFPWFFFYKNPGFFKAELTFSGNLNKLGGVLLLLWLSDRIARRWKGKAVAVLMRAAKESLFVYGLHLFIIFGSIFGKGLKPAFENSLTLLSAIGLFLLLQAFVFTLALAYGFIKERKQPLWRWGFNVFWAGFFIFFIIRRW